MLASILFFGNPFSFRHPLRSRVFNAGSITDPGPSPAASTFVCPLLFENLPNAGGRSASEEQLARVRNSSEVNPLKPSGRVASDLQEEYKTWIHGAS